MGAEPQQVAGDTLKFGENGADDAGAWGGASDDEKFFDCFAIDQAVADGGNVIHAIDIGSELLVRAILGDFLDAEMQKADDALGANDAFAVELELDAQDAMGGWVLAAPC